jgi:ubiquinone/menaquinone biosynthesis C-methylase UbiE
MSATTSYSSPLVESELRSLLLRYRQENWQGIQTAETQEKVVEDILQSGCAQVLDALAPYFAPAADAKILDIGSGVGSFVAGCRDRGFTAYGIEPDRIGAGAGLTSIQIAARRLQDSVFVSGVGECLPFADKSFDLISLNQVIEHVASQQAVIHEAARVLKPGGAMYVACPNYLRFYEPHYKIAWLPMMPRWLGSLYLRIRGRNPVMLHQLSYTTNRRLNQLLKSLGEGYRVLDLHREDFLRKLNADAFASAPAKFVARLIQVPLFGALLKAFVLLYLQIREGGCSMVVLRKPEEILN